MKPRSFEYVRPKALPEAVALLAQADMDAQILAGGQSLVPMMNLRVASPKRIVDIARLPELLACSENGSAVTLGACVTHATIEDRCVPDPSLGLMPTVAAGLAYRAVRNKGTIGGSLALADPAGEWPTVLAALDARVVLCGPNGRRNVDAAGFVTGIYETQLAGGELVESIVVPRLPPDARWGYVKSSRKSGAFADSVVAIVQVRSSARVVLGACNGAPLLLKSTSALAGDGCADAERLADAVSDDLAAAGDRQFDDLQTELHSNIVLRAVGQVLA
jgi:carbon-monoxide dehydrogenase medium subunit